jgi:hypothetical protein
MRIVRFTFFVVVCVTLSGSALLAQLDSTNLPLFLIETNGLPIQDEPKITASLRVVFGPGDYNHIDDPANVYDGFIGIEIRGKYSASLPQKPYGLEAQDMNGDNLNVPFFHMPSENDWILLANYNDKTFMRNSLTFELFRKMGHYAPRTQFCEVVVNGSYQGIYVFTEKIKRDKGRVDIATLNVDENSGDDLSGGYIIKVDYYNEYNSWKSDFHPLGQPGKDVFFVYEYPKEDKISGEQKQYIRTFIDELETILYSAGYSLQKVSRYIDVPSFIDYFILNELARNVDAYKKSSFFHKDKDSNGGLLHAGPVWDFDWAWKNINECYFGATDGSGWAYEVHKCDPWPVPPSWMSRLMQDPSFATQVNERYFALRESFFSEESIFNYIDSVALLLATPQKRHYQKWPILGINVGAPEVDEQPATYIGEIEKFKQWIARRLGWLDANMPSVVVTGIEDNRAFSEPDIFPNPTDSGFTIRSERPIVEVSLFSTNGQLLYDIRDVADMAFEMDMMSLPGGLYIVKTHTSDGSVTIGKIMKTR